MRPEKTHMLIALAVYCAIFPCISYGFEKDGFRFHGGPHCGLYCVYGAARYLGTDVNFVDLVKPEYVGRERGSSLDELKRCAEDIGLEAQAVQNMDERFLRHSSGPVIMHVKEEYESKDYSHYVLFMGAENDQAVLLDSSEIRRVSFGDLLPLMDGVGLVVSNENIGAEMVIWAQKGRLVAYTVLVFAGVVIMRVLFEKERCRKAVDFLWCPAGTYIAQAGVLIAVGFAAAFLFHFFGDSGYLCHAKYTEPVISSHGHTFLHKISKDEVKALLRQGAAIVDARYHADFTQGHIDRAISLPIDANDNVKNDILKYLNRDRRIVVYCQSARCQYANITALWLKEKNYDNISVYRGGWVDWVN
jgi:rhodanese-related sulfurtransferase